jgi:hypothetical protein
MAGFEVITEESGPLRLTPLQFGAPGIESMLVSLDNDTCLPKHKISVARCCGSGAKGRNYARRYLKSTDVEFKAGETESVLVNDNIRHDKAPVPIW